MLPPVLGAALLAASLSYVESSQGLVDAPRFEAGNTEFEMADLNGDGLIDLVSIGVPPINLTKNVDCCHIVRLRSPVSSDFIHNF